MTINPVIPAVSLRTGQTGQSARTNEMGMRPMQEAVYEKRGEQYLLIKSPPASGKSRALMFVALDKLAHQGVKKALIVVPERSIGGSFMSEPLSKFGFWADWIVQPKWNLCNAPGSDEGQVARSKVKAVGEFLKSEDQTLVCTHATFRFAAEELGIAAFDGCLVAVDEFHHVSADPKNRLGYYLNQLIARGETHIIAMTGSYFRGDAVAVLSPEDEGKFETVTYTYYQQLNGYQYLKELDLGYYFYTGSYLDAIDRVLDGTRKTIVHIPNVNSRESTTQKHKEVEHILSVLGDWEGEDIETGFHLVRRADGRVLRIADLVEDEPVRRNKVVFALKDPAQKNNRDHVDIIIALGMAKEGFDWIWCEQALTVGYRSSLTEIIQIIGRATRDAPGKIRAEFINLIAEPDASQEKVTDAVNDMLKAIAASLLMEQVLTPRFEFTPKTAESAPLDGYDYGEEGYKPNGTNVGFNEQTGQFHMEIKGLVSPKSLEAQRICREDLNEVVASFVQDKPSLEHGLFDEETAPQELTQVRLGKIIRDRYPELSDEDREAVRQHAVAAFNLTQKGQKAAEEITQAAGGEEKIGGNTALIEGMRKIAMNVRDLDIDLIDAINPFEEAYKILARSMNAQTLKQVQEVIASRHIALTIEEARDLAKRALLFKKERGRLPELTSPDAWERKMAEGVAVLARKTAEERANG